MHRDVPVGDLDERLGARADDRVRFAGRIVEREEVHVRRGVERAQHAVDVEGVGRAVGVEALRDDDLEHVAIAHELLRAHDGGLVVRLRAARARRRRRREIDLCDVRHRRPPELGLEPVEPRLRVLPERVGIDGGAATPRSDAS